MRVSIAALAVASSKKNEESSLQLPLDKIRHNSRNMGADQLKDKMDAVSATVKELEPEMLTDEGEELQKELTTEADSLNTEVTDANKREEEAEAREEELKEEVKDAEAKAVADAAETKRLNDAETKRLKEEVAAAEERERVAKAAKVKAQKEAKKLQEKLAAAKLKAKAAELAETEQTKAAKALAKLLKKQAEAKARDEKDEATAQVQKAKGEAEKMLKDATRGMALAQFQLDLARHQVQLIDECEKEAEAKKTIKCMGEMMTKMMAKAAELESIIVADHPEVGGMTGPGHTSASGTVEIGDENSLNDHHPHSNTTKPESTTTVDDHLNGDGSFDESDERTATQEPKVLSAEDEAELAKLEAEYPTANAPRKEEIMDLMAAIEGY